MPPDDILAELSADWKRQTVDHGRLRARTERRRRWTRLALTAKAAATGGALLAGIWFARLALSGEAPAFALAGFVLLAASPLMLMELIGTMRLARIGASDAPEGALRAARAQAVAALHLLWGARAGALLLTASALGLTVLHAAGKATAGEAATIAPVWLVAALIAWLWQARRASRLKAEIAHCDLMLDELREAESR